MNDIETAMNVYCTKCGLGKREWMACDYPDCGELKQPEQTTTYGIVDPDYARVFTQVRCIAWMYGHAVMFNGSFTRDLDLLIVPWTESVSPATTPQRLINLICDRCHLQEAGHPPSQKPHGRIAYTLMFKEPKDPRFIDISFMPQAVPV
jgi:hypothetical protein